MLLVQHLREQGQWLHHSPCSLGCWTKNTRAERSLSPNEYYHSWIIIMSINIHESYLKLIHQLFTAATANDINISYGYMFMNTIIHEYSWNQIENQLMLSSLFSKKRDKFPWLIFFIVQLTTLIHILPMTGVSFGWRVAEPSPVTFWKQIWFPLSVLDCVQGPPSLQGFPAFFIKPWVWFLGDGGCPWYAVICGLGYVLDKWV